MKGEVRGGYTVLILVYRWNLNIYARLREPFSLLFNLFPICTAPRVLTIWSSTESFLNLTMLESSSAFQVVQFGRSNFCRGKKTSGGGKNQILSSDPSTFDPQPATQIEPSQGFLRRTTTTTTTCHSRPINTPFWSTLGQWRLPSSHNNELETSPGQWRSGRGVSFACT